MKPPIIVAHRGLHVEHVENSLAALHAAWAAGINWCEIDVRGSIEHQPFLMHDATLERTTAGAGPIDQTPSSVLRALGVPSLHELVDSMPSGAKLLIEIKPGVAREVVRRTMEACNRQTCMMQSFDRWVSREAGLLRSGTPIAELVEEAIKASLVFGLAVHARHDTLFPGIVDDLHERGLTVGAWTVNTALDIERMLELNIDRIITDEPLRARDICGKIG